MSYRKLLERVESCSTGSEKPDHGQQSFHKLPTDSRCYPRRFHFAISTHRMKSAVCRTIRLKVYGNAGGDPVVRQFDQSATSAIVCPVFCNGDQ